MSAFLRFPYISEFVGDGFPVPAVGGGGMRMISGESVTARFRDGKPVPYKDVLYPQRVEGSAHRSDLKGIESA